MKANNVMLIHSTTQMKQSNNWNDINDKNLIQDEIENLDIPLLIEEIEFMIKTFPTKKTSSPNALTTENPKEEIYTQKKATKFK